MLTRSSRLCLVAVAVAAALFFAGTASAEDKVRFGVWSPTSTFHVHVARALPIRGRRVP